MTDIVERLRSVSPDDYDECCSVMNKAADEIERLRAALESIANTTVSSWVGDIHEDAQNEWRDRLDDAISIARAALGGDA